MNTVSTKAPAVTDERASVKVELSVKRKLERLQEEIKLREELRSRPSLSDVIDRLVEFHGTTLAA